MAASAKMLRSSSWHSMGPLCAPVSRASFSSSSRKHDAAAAQPTQASTQAGRGRGRGSTVSLGGITVDQIAGSRPMQASQGRGGGRGRGGGHDRPPQRTFPQTGTQTGNRPLARDGSRPPRFNTGQFDDAPPQFAQGSLAARVGARRPPPSRAETMESKYASLDLQDIAALERAAGVGGEGGSSRSFRGMGRGNFRGRGRGMASRGRGGPRTGSFEGRGGFRGRGARRGAGRGGRGDSMMLSDRQDNFNFSAPAPTTILDAKGNYTFATAAPDQLSPKPVQAGHSSTADYSQEETEVAQTVGRLNIRVPGVQNAVGLSLPKGIDAPKASSSTPTSTALTPLRWSDLVPEPGTATKEEALGKAIEAMVHHNRSMRTSQKAKTAALVGFIASTRQEREALIRKR